MDDTAAREGTRAPQQRERAPVATRTIQMQNQGHTEPHRQLHLRLEGARLLRERLAPHEACIQACLTHRRGGSAPVEARGQ